MRYFMGLVGAFLLALFVGCGGGGGDSSNGSSNNVQISILDGYIIDANVSDGDNTPVKYQSEEKTYRFYDTPQEYIKASGGKFESGLENKMSFSVPADTKVITPVVDFLNEYPDLKQTIAKALDVSSGSLSEDYIKNSNLSIAKFAQIVYAMDIHGLIQEFAKAIEDATTYESIAYSATKVSAGNSHEDAIKNFIYALDDLDDVSDIEEDIYSKKKIMQQNVISTDADSSSSSGESADVLNVNSVSLVGNLGLDVLFSEKVVVNTDKQKGAFSLNQIIHSDVALDDNATLQISAKSLTLPLQSAITTEESSNTYTVKATNRFLSSEGLSLGEDEIKVSPSAENLVLEEVEFINSKKVTATFNLPIELGSINQGEFSISTDTISYKPTTISIDSTDDKTLIITLGNTLTTNLGYDLTITSEDLSATNGTSKLLDGKATMEFTAKVNEDENLSEGFNILSASVDEEQKNITLTFSKDIMSNPDMSMFSVSLDALQEAMDINVSEDNGTSATINITPSSVLLSPEQNSSYKLSVAKQTIYSVDGGRTLGSTYEKIFEIENYPTVTASLSGKTISIKFNMSMDLNTSDVSVTQNGSEANATLSGSGTNYTITSSEDFNQSSTTLKITSGFYSSDKKYMFDADYTKDFNSSE